MNKKEKSINSHIDKAIGYSDKAHDELQIALNIALEGKGLSDEEKELLSVGFATGTEEAVERVADGSCNDEYIGAWDSPIRDCRISEVYRMTGEPEYKPYTHVLFINGYRKDSPRIEKEIESITIGKPKEGLCPDKWLDTEFFIIKFK